MSKRDTTSGATRIDLPVRIQPPQARSTAPDDAT